MANFSFDIVSEVDFQELNNALNQARKELSQRYDFRGSKASIELKEKEKEKQLVLIGDDDYKLKSLKDILVGQLAKRGVSYKSFDFKDPERAFEGTLRQVADIVSGIPHEKTKEINAIIRDLKLKVQTQVEGPKIRVSSAKKDDLQAVIAHLRTLDFSLPLNFTNYR